MIDPRMSKVLVLIAVVILVLTGFGYKVSDFSELDQIAFGLAFGFAASLV